MNENARNWEEIRGLLREAQALISPGRRDQSSAEVPVGTLVGTLDEFDVFLEHNELELAWEALAEMATRSNGPRESWHKLARAADLMHLPEKREEAQKRATPPITSDRALAVARQDAEGAYRDLLKYRVSLMLEPDGWHVDYELSGALMAGGGPHYVIDATTGAIRSKRYEQ